MKLDNGSLNHCFLPFVTPVHGCRSSRLFDLSAVDAEQLALLASYTVFVVVQALWTLQK